MAPDQGPVDIRQLCHQAHAAVPDAVHGYRGRQDPAPAYGILHAQSLAPRLYQKPFCLERFVTPDFRVDKGVLPGDVEVDRRARWHCYPQKPVSPAKTLSFYKACVDFL